MKIFYFIRKLYLLEGKCIAARRELRIKSESTQTQRNLKNAWKNLATFSLHMRIVLLRNALITLHRYNDKLIDIKTKHHKLTLELDFRNENFYEMLTYFAWQLP